VQKHIYLCQDFSVDLQTHVGHFASPVYIIISNANSGIYQKGEN